MDCYVCGTPRPEGANYCPGCGRYCADDPNVRNPIHAIPEDFPPEEAVPEEVPVEPEASEPIEKPVPDASETPVPPEVPDAPDSPDPFPKRRKKHRPVLIPVLIMAVLFTVGTVCWFLMPYPSDTGDTPPETTQVPGTAPTLPPNKRPSGESVPDETYAPTDERCFRIENGIVSFLPERFDGERILVIPSEIDGQTVTGIADEGFRGLEDVTTLVLPETLKTIGDSAFADCKKLRGVYIPDSVISIGAGAFSGCTDMESVSIPVGTTSIGADAFGGCASLMFVFYEGSYEQWTALYNEYITPYTYAICSDGEYYHGVNLP